MNESDRPYMASKSNINSKKNITASLSFLQNITATSAYSSVQNSNSQNGSQTSTDSANFRDNLTNRGKRGARQGISSLLTIQSQTQSQNLSQTRPASISIERTTPSQSSSILNSALSSRQTSSNNLLTTSPRTSKASGVTEGSADANVFIRDQIDQRNHHVIHKNFVLGINADTNVLDIPFDKMGTLCGVAPTISFIPDNNAIISSIRDIFIFHLRRIESMRDSGNLVEECLAWKKYFLLPTILFDNCRGERVKDVLRDCIKLLAKHDWSQFTLGTLQLKPMNQRLEFSDEDIKKRMTKLVSAGQISKAYRILTGDRTRLPQNEWAYNLLKTKFPEKGVNNLTDEQLEALRTFQPPRMEIPNEDVLRTVVMKQANMISHGFDHFRNEHIKKLFGWEDLDPKQAELRKLYKNVIERLMNGDIPEAVRPLYADTEAFAGPKSDTDIRPLGKINLDRKIAGALILRLNRKSILAAFRGVQYGSDPKGTEKIIHSIRLGMEIHPEYDFFAPDAATAFNSCNQEVGLFETMMSVPAMFSFAKFLYGSQSTTWFHGNDEGIKDIQCKEGSQQGCNLGNFLCGMAFLPFINGISSIIQRAQVDASFVKFFVDDGNIFSPFEIMLDILGYMRSEGPKFGYHMNLAKCVYLLGRCDSFETAMSKKRHLMSHGLLSENIHIHPDNYLGVEQFDEKYGVKVLGSYIGSPEFIKNKLEQKLATLQEEAEKIISCENIQQRYIFFRYCFDQKINHILRTTGLSLTEEFAEKFDEMKKKILCSILGQFDYTTLPNSVWIQSCLPTNHGGLGLDDSSRTRFAAYLGSIIDCMDTTDESFPGWSESTIPSALSIQTAINFIQETSTVDLNHPVILSIEDIKNLGRIKDDDLNKIGRQFDLNKMMHPAVLIRLKQSFDDKRLGWITSAEDHMSSRFLNVMPKCPSFTFESSEFRILLNLRLFIDQPDRSSGLRCDCRQHPIVDSRAHHLITGCPKTAFGSNIHNAICNTIKELANSAGIRVKREQVGAFQNIYVPGLTDTQRNMRPDLSLFDLPMSRRNVVLDISSAAPIPIFGNQPFNRDMASQPQRAADIRYREKMTKYDTTANANNLKFHPIIFETTGRMHSESLAFITSLLELFKDRFMNGALLKRYWLDRISCSYQHQVAIGIRDKLRFLKGSRYAQGNYENRADFVHLSSSICLPIDN